MTEAETSVEEFERLYRQAEDDQLEKMAVRIRGRAVRRAGELLGQVEPQQGANQNISGDGSTKVLTRNKAGTGGQTNGPLVAHWYRAN